MAKEYHSDKLTQMLESGKMALGSLKSHKFRSFMTIIGVMLGVGAVILLNTILEGFKVYTESSIEKIGTNVIYVQKWASHEARQRARDEGRRPPDLTMKEAEAIINNCPHVSAVAPQKWRNDNIAKYGDRIARNPDDYRGVLPEHAFVTNRGVDFGRFIDYNDMERRAMVCVLGPEICDALFDQRSDAVGKVIRINSKKFTVIGVQEEIEDFFGISENDFIFIPLTTFEKLYPEREEIRLLCSATSREDVPLAVDEITAVLRSVRNVRPGEENNFGLMTQDRFKDQVNEFTQTIRLAGLAISSVGLLVGLIGVMNIMLISVTERTREIGVRKAIGATKGIIRLQFLTEAATLTGLGGVAGIAAGALLGFIITSVLDWTYYLSVFWLVTGLILSAGTGIIAGTYPAFKASRLDPIEALRYE